MIELPVPYDWFVLICRLAVASAFLLFLWQLFRALVQSAFVPSAPQRLQLSPTNGGQPIPLRRSRQAIVGRDDDCDVVIPDPSVSSRHARLHHDAEGWVLTDLGSTNGTWVNGARVAEPVRIDAFDVVQFGRFSVQVTVVDADDELMGFDRAGNG